MGTLEATVRQGLRMAAPDFLAMMRLPPTAERSDMAKGGTKILANPRGLWIYYVRFHPEEIYAHLARFWGPPTAVADATPSASQPEHAVLFGMASGIHVCLFPPDATRGRAHWSVATLGLASWPTLAAVPQRCELVCYLPAEWRPPATAEMTASVTRENWAESLLRELCAYVVFRDRTLAVGDCLANILCPHAPLTPFFPGCTASALLIAAPDEDDPAFPTLALADGTTVVFRLVVPLTADEFLYQHTQPDGANALAPYLADGRIPNVWQPVRPSATTSAAGPILKSATATEGTVLLATANGPCVHYCARNEFVAARVLEQWLGPPACIRRTMFGDGVELLGAPHLYMYPPSRTDPARNHWTVVTAGLSGWRMAVPAHLGTPRERRQIERCELVCYLPPTWTPPAADDGLAQVNAATCALIMLEVACNFAVLDNALLKDGDDLANFLTPQTPFAPFFRGCALSAVWLRQADEGRGTFAPLAIGNDEVVNFYLVIPLTPGEYQLKRSQTSDALEPLLANGSIPRVWNTARPSAIRSESGRGGRHDDGDERDGAPLLRSVADDGCCRVL